MSRMKNLVAFVSGGASGIGRSIAERFVCQGARVCIADKDKCQGETVVKSMGDKAIFSMTDVTQECDVLESLNQTKECFGKVDIIVNSAGILKCEDFYNFSNETPHSEDTFRCVMETNLWGTFNVSRLAAGILAKNKPDEHEQRGIIINIASNMADDGFPGFLAYSATKSAIAGLTLPMARTLACKGIRVVGICPGYIETPMTETIEDPERLLCMQLCPRRKGTPDEVAHITQSIIENRIINATNIQIDCGFRYSQIEDAKEVYTSEPC